MHHRTRNIIGESHDCLTVIGYVGSNGKKSLWEVQCICGNVKIWSEKHFRANRSCGCMKGKFISVSRQTHGMSKHPAYRVWRSMIDRCSLSTHHAWRSYGARGITVCKRWQDAFENFWEDMGDSYQRGLTLDRIDNGGNYEPENCRWATYTKQARNRRNNTMVETPWGAMTVAEAADKTQIGRTTLYYRIAHQCPQDLLFAEPDFTNRFTTS